jgi:hypothetical protein
LNRRPNSAVRCRNWVASPPPSNTNVVLSNGATLTAAVPIDRRATARAGNRAIGARRVSAVLNASGAAWDRKLQKKSSSAWQPKKHDTSEFEPGVFVFLKLVRVHMNKLTLSQTRLWERSPNSHGGGTTEYNRKHRGGPKAPRTRAR